jgi:hypothetical protein
VTARVRGSLLCMCRGCFVYRIDSMLVGFVGELCVCVCVYCVARGGVLKGSIGGVGQVSVWGIDRMVFGSK